MPQKNRTPLPPIYVDSKNDPRYKAYQDSLFAYSLNKMYEDKYKYLGYESYGCIPYEVGKNIDNLKGRKNYDTDHIKPYLLNYQNVPGKGQQDLSPEYKHPDQEVIVGKKLVKRNKEQMQSLPTPQMNFAPNVQQPEMYNTQMPYMPWHDPEKGMPYYDKNTNELAGWSTGDIDNTKYSYQMGGHIMNKKKVRITALPQAKYGGALPGTGTNNGNRNQVLDTRWNFTTGTAFNQQEPYATKRTLPDAPDGMGDITVEKQEQVIGDFDKDGMPELMGVDTGTHASGNDQDINVPNGSFVYSDTKALKFKDPVLQAKYGITSAKTPAQIAKKYDLQKYKAMLDNPATDAMSRKTAQMMYDNQLAKLSSLAKDQEDMKSQMEQKAQYRQMKKGGYVPQYPGGGSYYPLIPYTGDKGTAWNQGQLEQGFSEWGYPNDPNGPGAGQWMQQNYPEILQKVNNRYGKPTDYTPENPIGSKYPGLRHQYAAELLRDKNTDYIANRPMDIVPPVVQGPDPNNLQSENIPQLNLGTVPSGDNTAKGSGKKFQLPQFNGIDANTLGDAAFALKALTTHKMGPWEAPVQSVSPSVTFLSDQPQRNAISEQANAISDRMANSANSRATRASLAALQGQVGSQAIQAVGQVGNANNQIANTGQAQAAQIMNNQLEQERARLNRLYQGNVISQQQYENSLNNLASELVGRAAMRQDQKYKNAWDDVTSKYFTHGPDGMPVFKSAYAQQMYNKDILGMHEGEGDNSTIGAYNSSYEQAYKMASPSMTEEEKRSFADDYARKKVGMDAHTRKSYDRNGQLRGSSTTQQYGGSINKLPTYSIGGQYIPQMTEDFTQQAPQQPVAPQTPMKRTGKIGADATNAGKYFVSQGIPAHIAAGIVGNIAQESGFNPNAINPTSGAFGLGQWLGKRKEKLFQTATAMGIAPTDMNFQLNYLINEPGESQKALSAMSKAKSPEEASVIWANTYERMGKAEANYNRRMNVAADVYGKLNSGPMQYGGPVTRKVKITELPS